MIGEVRQTFNDLRGSMFTMLEAMGVPFDQANAAKGLVRKFTTEAQAQVEATIRGG
jgi:hypothetical protein